MCKQGSDAGEPVASKAQLLIQTNWQLVEAYDPWSWLSKGQPKPHSFPRISDGRVLSFKEDGTFMEKHSKGSQYGGKWKLAEEVENLELEYLGNMNGRNRYRLLEITEKILRIGQQGRHGICVYTYESRPKSL